MGAYCIARDKLNEHTMHRVVTQTGLEIEESAPEEWLWLGHRVITGDGTEATQGDLSALFRRRWQAELNLRSLKTVMQIEPLRCKKPHRVRNEIRAHFIAYNLTRQVMCEAAIREDVRPWQISFKATMQTLNEMLPRPWGRPTIPTRFGTFC